MLDDALLFEQPFRYFLCFDSFTDAEASEMRQTLSSDLAWEARQGSFYRTERLDLRAFYAGRPTAPIFIQDDWLMALRDRMEDLFGESLSDEVQVLGHRMLPGQSIGVHNDNPGLGFENYRIITQLTQDHRPEHGGVLNLHLSDRSYEVWQSIRPCYNMSVGFEVSERSYHSVDQVTGPNRDAVLFNFWHIANDPAAERAVYRELAGLWSEACRSKADSGLIAAEIAHGLVQRWCGDPVLASRAALAMLASASPPDAEAAEARRLPAEQWTACAAEGGRDDAGASAALALASWLARAPRRNFSRLAWAATRSVVSAGRAAMPPAARSLADLLMPEALPRGRLA